MLKGILKSLLPNDTSTGTILYDPKRDRIYLHCTVNTGGYIFPVFEVAIQLENDILTTNEVLMKRILSRCEYIDDL
jgi:hypothetical protein